MDLPQATPQNPKKLTEMTPVEVLGPGGPISKQFENYEPRTPQIQMAEAVENNLKNKRHLFCEAGTGTGKSYAFLISAIKMALSGESPVVVSTNTISLQEQIFRKDIPDLMKYLNLPNLRVVLRKGRGNYLSLRRTRNAQNYEWDPEQIAEFEDIETWAEQTSTGALQDMDHIPTSEVWEQVRSDQYDCLGQKCPKYKDCFYFKSKDAASKAHLIICNHALLCLDLGIKYRSDNAASILPDFKHLIVDEAHALEDAIRKSETFEWKQGSAAALVRRATNRKKRGFLDGVLKVSGGVPFQVITQAKEAIKLLQQLAEVNKEFFEKDVEPWVKQGLRGRSKPPTSKRVKPGNLVSRRSDSLLLVLNKANKYLSNVASGLKRASADDGAGKDVKALAVLLENFKTRTKEIETELRRAIKAEKDQDQPYPTHVSSVETSEYNGRHYYTLTSTPIFVRNISQKILFSRIPSITLTSATLTTGNSFAGITRNLGTFPKNTDTLQLPHVFDFKKQTRIYLTPKTPLDPWNKPAERKQYFDTIADLVKKYVYLTDGHALVLCTSNLQMKALYERTVDEFTSRGLYVLRQGGGMTREQLVHEIKTVPNTVLYGVDSFWTGIDVQGRHLQNVIIPKLPFPPPTPLSEAQQEMYDVWNRGKPRHKRRNYFGDRTVPGVAIKLQQGFGRLIRHRDDKGIVVILDQRMKTKGYGLTLLNSLPPCDVIIDNG
jgi:ATP-dependent DNA helicase DinG